MTEYFEDTTDVAVLVIRNRTDDGDYYLIARHRGNDFWEFVGGKRKKDESIEHAVYRELSEEIEIDWDSDEVDIVKTGDSFESPINPVYELYPVLVDIPEEVAWELGDEDLSSSHTSLKWIKIEELENFETYGEREALESLGVL